MNHLDLAQRRLHTQRIAGTPFAQAADVVRWLGAVQSQDFPAAKWALGQRTAGSTDADIQQAMDEGKILRTHVLRPTWHFVAPEDIRWMLELTAPRVKSLMSYAFRQLELDEAVFARSRAVLTKALTGGSQLTRKELAPILAEAGIATADLLRFGHILGIAELDGLVCNGAWRGKQPTYALLDEWVPPARSLERDEALAELALRYFTSHGPATLKDYVWWSGLTTADTRAGLEMVKGHLVRETVDGTDYWFAPSEPPVSEAAPSVYLLPNFDEYIVAYTDRSAIYDAAHNANLDARGNFLFSHTIVIDGVVAGIWKRTVKKNAVVIEPTLFRSLTDAEQKAFEAAMCRYGAFVGLPVTLN